MRSVPGLSDEAAGFQLSASAYGLNQLRYDLRKLQGHGLLQRDQRRYADRLGFAMFERHLSRIAGNVTLLAP